MSRDYLLYEEVFSEKLAQLELVDARTLICYLILEGHVEIHRTIQELSQAQIKQINILDRMMRTVIKSNI